MGRFALNIAQWVEHVKDRADRVCAAATLSLVTKMVLRSPVGNPELWAANATAALQRSEHNAVVDQINANLATNPANLTPTGRARVNLASIGELTGDNARVVSSDIKRKVRSASNKRLSTRQLEKLYPFAAGKGYVGGRFRGNWQVTIGTPTTTQLPRIDPSGSQSIADAAGALSAFECGPQIWITNNLPYGPRLEFEGWSKQAPAGMVRVSIAEFQDLMREAVERTP